MSFSRTPSGLAAEYLLYEEILVYVEGYTDIAFYDTVLQNYKCHIKAKNGKEECEKLATNLLEGDYPYVVILDGNYEILERTRSKHRRIILLQRHSFENYLFEKEPIEQFCWDHSHLEEGAKKTMRQIQKVVTDTELNLKELIVLDVAHQRSNTGYKVLPHSPEQFFKTPKRLNFRDDKIQDWCEKATQCIDNQSIENARNLVEKFLRKRRFIDLLPRALCV